MLQLTIGWLYPSLMSTYGDRGNILVLQKRCEWRGIGATVVPIDQEITPKQLTSVDLIFGGGSQDREQEMVMRDLRGKKATIIKVLIEENKPALFVCGSPQLMGNWYEPSVGQRIEGLGIFDMTSKHPGPDQPRLIGNTVANVVWANLNSNLKFQISNSTIVGFENHGGRTYLGKNAKPFAKIIKGFGNNGEDGTEGVIYKNAIGCYFHGPLLPKNPHVADFMIQRALEVKYQKEIQLKPLDDTLEWQAHQTIVKRLGITV
jgi:CobQ-like glutamine amidotransferase family enzyme